jgi:hypothetical protein
MKKINLFLLTFLVFVGSSNVLRAQFLAVDDQFSVTASAFPMVVGNVLANDNLSNPSITLTTPILSGPIILSTNGDVTIAANLEPMSITISYTICMPGTVLFSTAICMVTVTPVPPVAPFTQTLPFNSTIANLVVWGQNIQWYANPSAGRSVNELPLPLTTPLVNGNTYYASQTINGIESKERIPVTVVLSALATANYTFADFIQHFDSNTAQLHIENGKLMDEVSVYAISGKAVFTQSVQSNKANLSLASLSNGIYIVVVKADGIQHNFKLVK